MITKASHDIIVMLAIVFLCQVVYAKTTFDELALASEKNDVVDAVLSQPRLPDGYAVSLLSQLDDPSQGMVWHNYILQKLDVLYLRPDVGQEMRPIILDRLWKESRSPTATFAGTSLMTLLRLHEKRPDVVRSEKLAKHCTWVIDHAAYSNSDKLSALHVLSGVNQAAAAEIARKWLVKPETAPMLQLTALAVLGQEGSPIDLSLIESFTNHSDLRLRTAASKALAK